jgi:hypothetical protein
MVSLMSRILTVRIPEVLLSLYLQVNPCYIGWPCVGLRFKEGTDVEAMLQRLYAAAEKYEHKAFEVYTKDTMPERFHFSHNPRIAPIYLVPYLGYALTRRTSKQYASLGVCLQLFHPSIKAN